VPPGCVKVSVAVFCGEWDSGSFKILADHRVRLAFPQLRKQRFAGRVFRQPLLKQINQLGVQRQDISFAVLRIASLKSQYWGLPSDLETFRSQAGNFTFSEAGQIAEQVDPRSLLTAVALIFLIAGTGSLDKPRHLILCESPSLLSDIHFRISQLQIKQWIGSEPTGDKPVHEFLDRLDVVVDCARAQIATPLDRHDRLFDPIVCDF
jgi:hypothetical protein